jgi:hypothetical protein
MALIASVLWAGGELPLWEVCRLSSEGKEFRLGGTVVGKLEDTLLEVRYEVRCSHDWQTRQVDLHVRRGEGAEHRMVLQADENRRWFRDGEELPALYGMLDVDLGITPSTNTLPIRRLPLAVGESADLTAVWVKFPHLTIEPLVQRYTRLSERRFVYESSGGRFRAELEVDGEGLVRSYGTFWRAIV